MSKGGHNDQFYRTMPPRRFEEAEFVALTDDAKLLELRLRLGPETGPLLGVVRAGRLQMAEAMGWPPRHFDRAFARLTAAGIAEADWKSRLVWLPAILGERGPDNPNQVVGWRRYYFAIPDCRLKEKILKAMVANLTPKGAAFAEALSLMRAGSQTISINGRKKGSSNGRGNGSPQLFPKQDQEGEEEEDEDEDLPSGGSSELAADGSVSEPASPLVFRHLLTFPCAGEIRTWGLTQAQVTHWLELFPALDVLAEARKALAWIETNHPKTARGMRKFLVRWLNRAQDQTRGNLPGRIDKVTAEHRQMFEQSEEWAEGKNERR